MGCPSMARIDGGLNGAGLVGWWIVFSLHPVYFWQADGSGRQTEFILRSLTRVKKIAAGISTTPLKNDTTLFRQ
jgi:hypothetical protein